MLPSLSEMLPHRPPMLLLTAVDHADAEAIVCRVQLEEGAAFVREGRAGAHVAIEYMAQAVAAFAGSRSLAEGRPVEVGYLIGARDVTFEVDWLYVGDELTVEARRVWGDDVLGSFNCRVSRAGAPIAEGSLNVYRGSLDAAHFGAP